MTSAVYHECKAFNQLINSLQGLSYHELCQQYPDIINKLHALDAEISGGTTATVVLIYNNKLYMANVGEVLS